jgi:hypothetical protein
MNLSGEVMRIMRSSSSMVREEKGDVKSEEDTA